MHNKKKHSDTPSVTAITHKSARHDSHFPVKTADNFLPMPPAAGLDAYVSWINQIPLLSAAEEQDLAKRLRDENDVDAARRLVLSHLRYVVSITRSYLSYQLGHFELIQEGNIGLLKAVKRFDPDMGVRLATFAVHWIKSEIHEYILRNWRMVKVATTKAQRKLFFNLRRLTKKTQHLLWLTNAEVREIAVQLGVSEKEVRVMEMRISRHGDTAFEKDNERTGSGDAGGFTALSPSEYLTAPEQDPATLLEAQNTEQTRHTRLQSTLMSLAPRMRDVLMQRRLQTPKATLQSLATHYGVSIERIRQIEAQAMKILKQTLLPLG